MTVDGMIKTESKKEREKAQSKSKFSNRNSRAKSTGPSKKLLKWLKSQDSLRARSINGAGTKRRKI